MAPRLAPCWRRLTTSATGAPLPPIWDLCRASTLRARKAPCAALPNTARARLRRTLVLAAQTLLIRAAKDAKAGQPLDRLRQWALDLAARKHRNVAVTAIAARLARIAWAVIAHNTPYRSKPAA